ncbi:serine/threonine-protein kinase [Streptomyces sp. SAI-25]|uniref:serine/threonine-protein kinase n=1 Tax=Streptomyces sp. SAI-25 TaxID=1472664 RepID=UPI004039DC0A
MPAIDPQPRFPSQDVSAALGQHAEFLGAGAFGDTWRVGSEAVKIICKDDYELTRLEREIEGLSRVSSPFVVDFRGAIEIHLGGLSRSCLRFEYITGGDVEGQLKKRRLLPADESYQFLEGLLEGVRALHEAATIHRDIKPANIALRDGDWKKPVILDLGLAKQIDSSTITVYPGLIGTLTYMAPEQLQGLRARKAADLWAIGVTVREAITGVHPFYTPDIRTLDEAMAALEAGPAPLPEGTPGPVVDVLDRLASTAEYGRGSVASNLRRLRS